MVMNSSFFIFFNPKFLYPYLCYADVIKNADAIIRTRTTKQANKGNFFESKNLRVYKKNNLQSLMLGKKQD